MSPRARLLYHRPNATACLAFCSEPCLFYDLCQPPLPPIPAESPVLSTPDDGGSDSTPVQLRSSSRLVPVLPIAAGAFAGAVLIVFLAIFGLLRYQRRRGRRPHSLAGGAAGNEESGGDEDDLDGGVVDHHVWYIRTKGLDQSAIEAITAWEYKSGDGIIGAGVSDCAVCLGEFRDGELLRLLPKCGHAFHLSCIDTWLRSHVNCPLCRAPIEVPRAPSGREGGNEGTLAPQTASGVELHNPSLGPSSRMNGAPVTVGNSEPESDELVIRVGISDERSELGVGSGINIGRVASCHLGLDSAADEAKFMQVHRSASMNSLPLVFSVDSRRIKYNFKEEDNKYNTRGNDSKGHSRAQSSILPL